MRQERGRDDLANNKGWLRKTSSVFVVRSPLRRSPALSSGWTRFLLTSYEQTV